MAKRDGDSHTSHDTSSKRRKAAPDSWVIGGDDQDEPSNRTPAVCYVRMSTDNQRYSIANQACQIATYAELHGFKIIRTYADEGKSGLTMARRDAFKALIEAVKARDPTFRAILVYDVSRWGRFQDPDEAASLELQCRSRGFSIHYCAEQFDNSGSLASAIMKTMKRAMAGEYSRELSVKVHAGQSRIASMGFALGGPTSYGLRRVMVDENGTPRTVLIDGERKCIQSDRVRLVPGSAEEIARVNSIFRQYIDGAGEQRIADRLNREGGSPNERPWTWLRVQGVLTNQRYIGHLVWNRGSTKLGQRRVLNDPHDWIIAEHVIEPIVSKELFEKAQAVRLQRRETIDSATALAALRRIYRRHGRLSSDLIDLDARSPSSAWFSLQFGGLIEAYKAAGCVGHTQFSASVARGQVVRERQRLTGLIADQIERFGGAVEVDGSGKLIINGFLAVAVFVLARITRSGDPHWRWRRQEWSPASIVVIGCLDSAHERCASYYIVPADEIDTLPVRLHDADGSSVRAYRRKDLNDLFALSKMTSIVRAA